jgi:peptidoglycan-N-acetylglucosamine deacetylase
VRVALTFDAEHPDRPHTAGVQEQILDLLRDEGVRATFFLQGRWVEAFPATARRVVDDGHLVGNHSFYHARLPLLSDDGIATDVLDAERVIRDIAGADPKPWFRCPFSAGSDDPRVIRILERLGYANVGQDVVLDDWEPERTAEAIARDALLAIDAMAAADADGRATVLFHAWPFATLGALPAIIGGLRSRGCELTDVSQVWSDRARLVAS